MLVVILFQKNGYIKAHVRSPSATDGHGLFTFSLVRTAGAESFVLDLNAEGGTGGGRPGGGGAGGGGTCPTIEGLKLGGHGGGGASGIGACLPAGTGVVLLGRSWVGIVDCVEFVPDSKPTVSVTF